MSRIDPGKKLKQKLSSKARYFIYLMGLINFFIYSASLISRAKTIFLTRVPLSQNMIGVMQYPVKSI